MQTKSPTPPESVKPSPTTAPSAAATALCEQPNGRACQLLGLSAGGRLGQRLADMGFLAGLAVCVIRRAPLGDPLEVDLGGVRLCIRAEEARHVLVRPLSQKEARS